MRLNPKKIVAFLSISVMGQGIAALTGLYLARNLSIHEYSIYTIIVTISAALTVLTKGGLSMGLNAILGRTWPNKAAAQEVLFAANSERKRASIFILPVVIIMASWLLFKSGATALILASLLVLILCQWAVELKTRNIEQFINFANFANKLQVLDALVAFLRLALVLLISVIQQLTAVTGFLASIIALICRIKPIFSWWNSIVPSKSSEKINKEYAREIRIIYKRQLPTELFYVLQLQAVLIIISFFGTTNDTAAFGALSRIGQLLAPFSVLVGAYAVPHFVQCKQHVLRSLLKWCALTAVPGIILVVLSIVYPEALLWLIGPNYANLNSELIVFCIGLVISLTATTFFQLVANKGWNKYSYIQIPIVLAWVIVASLTLDLSKLSNTLWILAVMPIGQIVAAGLDLLAARRKGEV